MHSWVDHVTRLGLIVPNSAEAQVSAFLDDLYAQNAVMNLTRVSREDADTRHVLDSLLWLDLVPVGAQVLDLGTGPGFPAWPLAVVRPDVRVTALDSNGKMIGFLQRHPLPNLTVVQARIEDWPIREAFDVVTGRAFAPLPIQMEVSAGPLVIGGVFVPLRTPSDAGPVGPTVAAQLGLALEREVTRALPGADVDRYFPVYRKIKPTPERYPRAWAEIRRKPLG